MKNCVAVAINLGVVFSTSGCFIYAISGDLTKKMMPIGVVMDERICTGYEYAAFCNDFRRYMRLPRMLEYPFCQEEPAKEPSQETAAV